MVNELGINCDGGARGNPGPAASAFVVRVGGKIIYKNSSFLGVATNNVAEYGGVIAALKWVIENKEKVRGKNIIFFLDSELITKQLLGIFKTKNQKLKKLLITAKLLESKISGKLVYNLIPREKNTDADLLVNRNLDNQEKISRH